MNKNIQIISELILEVAQDTQQQVPPNLERVLTTIKADDPNTTIDANTTQTVLQCLQRAKVALQSPPTNERSLPPRGALSGLSEIERKSVSEDLDDLLNILIKLSPLSYKAT